MTDKLLEKLAALEHEQWSHWTKYFLSKKKTLFDDLDCERWSVQANTPYEKLTEKEKESDRKWARIILEKILSENAKKAVVFVEHIEQHIWNGDEKLPPDAEVLCKICGKTIDEIFDEEA